MAGRHVVAVLAIMGIFTANIISAETAEVGTKLMHEIVIILSKTDRFNYV